MCLNCVPHTPLLNCVCVRFFPLFRPYFLFFTKPDRLILNALLLTKQARRKKNGTTCLFTCDKNSLAVLSLFVCLFFVARHYFSASCSFSLSVTLLTKRFNAKKKNEVRYMFYLQVQSVNYASPLSFPLSCISFFFFRAFTAACTHSLPTCRLRDARKSASEHGKRKKGDTESR